MKKFLFLSAFLILGAVYFISCDHDSQNLTKTELETEFNVEKLTGAEIFAQYHSNIRKSPKGSPFTYKSGYQVKEYENLKKRLPASSDRALTWEERGPGNVSGRTRSIWLDPSDNTGETWFVGSAQGGVWKTEDAGQTYTIKTPNVPHLGTAAIMGCQSAPNVIYAGSGEGFDSFTTAGAGIYKTIDGGETWTVLEATTNNEMFANIYRMAVHPDNPDMVFAATCNNNSASSVDGHVMRSKDGGETWEEVLYHFDIIPHIVMSPENGDILYAGLNQEGVLKSVDGGDNWDFVWLYENAQLRPGRIELAISPSDPNYVYFTTPIDDFSGLPGDQIFISDDAGETFQKIIPNEDQDNFSEFSGPQSFWNKAITVDPFNPLKLYFAGLSSMLSLDVEYIPGVVAIGELTVITDGYGNYSDFFETSSKGVHVDHHGIVFSVVDEATQEVILINSNDGGIAVSRDNGATFQQTGDTFLQGFNPEGGNWTTIDGYNVSTFYGVDKMNGADRYVGGTQDNGSWVSPENPDATSIWSYAPSGDGFEAAWNYNDPNLIIESSQFNNLHRSDDGGETWYRLQPPGFGPFVSAIANSKQDGDMVMISTNNGPALSIDFGTTWIESEVPDEYVYNFSRTPIEISLFDPSVVWTGTGVNDYNRICLSTDGGQTFAATAQYEPQTLGEVAGIATHPSDLATAYAVFGTAGQPKIIRTTDSGQSWEDISGFEGTTDGTSSRGFPDVAVFSLLVMPYDNNIIWAGTEIGIVESLDNGESWNLIDDDLPATGIWEMKVVNDEVVIATHGRGIWTTTLPELEGYEPPSTFLLASKLKGDFFDKKLSGTIQHLTPIDSGNLTVRVETPLQIFTRTYPFGAVQEPSQEAINLDFEDFDIGDFIYDAELAITTYRGNEERYRKVTRLFYDVDADDPVENYSDDFNDGNDDFAVGQVSGINGDFSVGTPNGFENNGLESVHSFDDLVHRTIFQKPVLITETGSMINFDEIAILEPGFDFGGGFFYPAESIVLEATKNKGKSWVQLAEYSSEINGGWLSAYNTNSDPTNDSYMKRTIILSNFFDVGDEIYFKLEMNVGGFSNAWGYILDNFVVESSVATKDELLVEGISSKIYMNPFVTSTKIELTYPNSVEVGQAYLTDMNGQTYNASIQENKTEVGGMYEIDGTNLASGIYFFNVRVGSEYVTEKIVKI